MGGEESKGQRIGAPTQQLQLDEDTKQVVKTLRERVDRFREAELVDCKTQIVSGVMYILTFKTGTKRETVRVWSQPWRKFLEAEFEDKTKMAL